MECNKWKIVALLVENTLDSAIAVLVLSKKEDLLSFDNPNLGSKREVSRNVRKGKNFREVNSLKSTREQEAKIMMYTDIQKRNQL